MTALSDALTVAQARAVAGLAKSYVAERIDGDGVRETLAAIGLTDEVDTGQWLAALDAIREHGGQAPAQANGAKREDEPATPAQLARIRRDCEAKQLQSPDGPLTKAQASQIIEQIAASTYDASTWTVPF